MGIRPIAAELYGERSHAESYLCVVIRKFSDPLYGRSFHMRRDGALR